MFAIDVAESRLDVSSEVGATTVVLADGRKLSRLGGGDDARADVVFDPSLVVQRELALRGAFAATADDFATAVGLVDSGQLWHEPLISHRFPLAEVERAFAAQAARDSAIKVMIRTPDGPRSF